MPLWFKRDRSSRNLPRLGRRDAESPLLRIELRDIMPNEEALFAQCALVNLQHFQCVAQISTHPTSVATRMRIAAVAGHALTRYHSIVEEFERVHGESIGVLESYREEIDAFAAIVRCDDWREELLSAVMTFGLLNDFFGAVAVNIPSERQQGLIPALSLETGEGELLDVLAQEISADPALSSPLALRGRRLVGDTLLLVRSVLRLTGTAQANQDRTLPIFTELIAAHTRRMDALSLTA